ncbi:MAG: hypothetical protein U1F68_11535 [Gammaproteobacteria bacterium]
MSAKEARVRDLINQWKIYRGAIPECDRYCPLASDLYCVRNPGLGSCPALSSWPSHLVDPDDEIMASVEHYFLTRCWVGTGQFPAWQVRAMRWIYNTGKEWGLTPRHNPNRPVTPPSEMQRKFQDEGVRDGEGDLTRCGRSAPTLPRRPPQYY